MADSVAVTSTSDLPAAPLDQSASPQAPKGSRKRRRSSKPSSAISPNSKFSKAALSPNFTPQALTGAAALRDEQRAKEEATARQHSPNPAAKALQNLLGSQSSGMSKPQDAPKEAITLSKPLAEVAPSIQAPSVEGKALSQNENTMQTSPQSTASFRTLESTPAATITANGASVASPGQMDDVQGDDDESPHSDVRQQTGDDGSGADPDEGRSTKAFTYPGPMLGAQTHRTSSLPQSGYGSSRDNNRQHNLKSHLLTHSHEKPYRCDTCEASFRRLHDLKRHTKLHTGERPHVCPICERSFARGDALARHNKGQGGCAGRRSSMGSYGGDEKHEDRTRAGDPESMPGIMYTGEASHEPEHMDEDTESPSGRSLPSIRKHEAPDDHHRQVREHPRIYQSRQPSTYPPVAARPPAGGLYPPAASPRGTPAQSPLNQTSFPPGSGPSSSFQSSGSNVFAQGGMTESPKPLSPAGMTSHQLGHPDSGIHRNRSPSLTQQMQQQQFGRRTTGHKAPPPMNLPPPHPGAGHPNAPQLPSLPGLNPPEPRFTLQSQAPGLAQLHSTAGNSLPGSHGPNSPSYPLGNMSSANNSHSSHSTGPHLSFDKVHSSQSQSLDQIWSYARSLEARIERLQDQVTLLQNQLESATQHQRPPPPQQQQQR
ncbi:hypothetical protein N7G274_001486 [Stereocaulon virgatum]|uniref:C2H2-type domain-containing protein n=1 Tax=Stereocaulon virgatum TaxID=373712 RepID=A0ABR4AMY0_9LECA